MKHQLKLWKINKKIRLATPFEAEKTISDLYL